MLPEGLQLRVFMGHLFDLVGIRNLLGALQPAERIGEFAQLARITREIVGDGEILRKLLGGGKQALPGLRSAFEVVQSDRSLDPAGGLVWNQGYHAMRDRVGEFPMPVARVN